MTSPTGPGNVDPDTVTDVVERYPVRVAVLYGSQVRGTATAASDVDVAVAFETKLSPADRLRQRIELTTDLAAALGTDEIDVADLEEIRPAVGRTALKDGTVLLGEEFADEYLEQFEAARERTAETHDERMERFDAVLDRLEARM